MARVFFTSIDPSRSVNTRNPAFATQVSADSGTRVRMRADDRPPAAALYSPDPPHEQRETTHSDQCHRLAGGAPLLCLLDHAGLNENTHHRLPILRPLWTRHRLRRAGPRRPLNRNPCVHEEWLSQVDVSTLEIEEGDFVSDQLLKRPDDVVWRVKFRDAWLYVYLAIEFQSTVDRWMALRMMVSVGLLYQHLKRSGTLTRHGRLLPVLPLMLYNGEARWTAPLEMSELIEPAPSRDLLRYRPQFHYLLLNEGRIAASDLAAMKSLAPALFRLAARRGPEDIRNVLGSLIDWLKEQRSVRRAFAVWMQRVLLPARIPGVELEEFQFRRVS